MNMLNILKPEIAFDGWAIAIIIFILTLICSGTIYLTRSKVNQKQKAGDRAKQKQQVSSATQKDESTITQKQKARDDAQQDQIA